MNFFIPRRPLRPEELFDEALKLKRDLAEKANEVARLRELLENILDAVPVMYREQYEQIIK